MKIRKESRLRRERSSSRLKETANYTKETHWRECAKESQLRERKQNNKKTAEKRRTAAYFAEVSSFYFHRLVKYVGSPVTNCYRLFTKNHNIFGQVALISKVLNIARVGTMFYRIPEYTIPSYFVLMISVPRESN